MTDEHTADACSHDWCLAHKPCDCAFAAIMPHRAANCRYRDDDEHQEQEQERRPSAELPSPLDDIRARGYRTSGDRRQANQQKHTVTPRTQTRQRRTNPVPPPRPHETDYATTTGTTAHAANNRTTTPDTTAPPPTASRPPIIPNRDRDRDGDREDDRDRDGDRDQAVAMPA